MKRYLIILMAALVLVLSACSGAGGSLEPLPTNSSSGAEAAATSPTTAPTTPPDFAGIDFSGSWYVDQLIDSNGDPVSKGEMQGLGSDFTLELLPAGTYFVYDAAGTVLGQGIYSAAQNLLTLTAGESQTVYEILDENTLQCKQADNSVTVMKRTVADPAEESSEEAVSEETEDSAVADTAEDETAGDTLAEGALIADSSVTIDGEDACHDEEGVDAVATATEA